MDSFISYDGSDVESVVEEFYSEVRHVGSGRSYLVRQNSNQTCVASNKRPIKDRVNVLTGVKKRKIN